MGGHVGVLCATISRCLVILLLAQWAGAVKELGTPEQFSDLIAQAQARGLPVIVEYVSQSCTKCTALEPVFQRIAKDFAGRAFFRKVDVKLSPEIAAVQDVEDRPTFHFWLQDRRYLEAVGEDVDDAGLREATKQVVEEAERRNEALGISTTSSTQSPKPAAIKAIEEPQEFTSLLSQGDGMPVIVEYLSPSCVTCAMLKPVFQALATEFAARAHFRVVDTKQNPQTASDYGVQEMPTFQFWLWGKKFHQLPGESANDASLREWVQRVVKQADQSRLEMLRSSTGSSVTTLSPAPTPAATPAPDPRHRFPCFARPRLRGTRPCKPLNAAKGNQGASSGSVDLQSVPLEDLRQELHRREVSIEMMEPAKNPCQSYRSRKAAATEKVVIVGGGPAGMAAAIYAARANLCPLVLAPAFGGQLSSKGVDVENYPGVPRANGAQMVAVMKQQALSFFAEVRSDAVLSVNTTVHPFEVSTTSSGLLKAHTIIWATGADSRWLHVDGEDEYKGHGVSGCAACDGFLYKGKTCAVIGGGDSAMEEALMLTRLCSEVTIVHRRDKFRASPLLQRRVLENPKVSVRWNSEVARFAGKAVDRDGELYKLLTHLELRNTISPDSVPTELKVDGAFIAIGHDPNTKLLRGQVQMDDQNYIIARERSSRTSVPGIFAAGDVADHTYRQAVTSAGSGAMAALDAHSYLAENLAEEEEIPDIEFRDIEF